MKEKIISVIKKNNFIGWLYVQSVACCYRILDFFIVPKPKRIIFTSFSGRQYSDSPRAIFEALRNDNSFKEFEFIWAFREPDKFPELDDDMKVKINSFSYLLALFKSRYWISNASIERLIPINSRKHVYINTWHGIPMKHLGPDEKNLEYIVKNWYSKVKFDVFLCSSDYDKNLFKHIFPSNNNVNVVGLPRNKQLVHESHNEKSIKNKVIEKLKLDPKKDILLYAPTFREHDLDISSKNNLFFKEEFLSEISKKYNILVRGHYFALENLNNNVFNVSNYVELNELMIASDILVSDYSSIIFDYLLLEKPILLYLYDYEKYSKYRGLYFDPNKFFDTCIDIDKLADKLLKKNFKDNRNLKKYFNDLEDPIYLVKDTLLSDAKKKN